MSDRPSVNITIVSQNRLNLTRICLESLLPTLRDGVYVSLIDNGSTDGSVDYLESIAASHPQVSLTRMPRNMGVSIASNYGWALRDTDYYCKLDNDVRIVDANWLENLVDVVENAPEVGMAGYCLFDYHERWPVTLSSGQAFMQSKACNGTCVVIPRRVHEVCGFWCEDYGLYGYEDVDYNNRAMLKGFLIGYLADGGDTVLHLGYEGEVDEQRETVKRTMRTREVSGEKLYLINKFLFENSVRDIKVERKYLPVTTGETLSFKLQESYRPIMRLQQEMLRNVPHTVTGDTVTLDFSSFTGGLKGE